MLNEKRIRLSEEEQRQIAQQCKVFNEFELDEFAPMQTLIEPLIFDDDDIDDLIKSIKTNTAAGPSGIDGNYIKQMNSKQKSLFKKLLSNVIHKIFNNP